MLEQKYKFANYDEDEDFPTDDNTVDPDREAGSERG